MQTIAKPRTSKTSIDGKPFKTGMRVSPSNTKFSAVSLTNPVLDPAKEQRLHAECMNRQAQRMAEARSKAEAGRQQARVQAEQSRDQALAHARAIRERMRQRKPRAADSVAKPAFDVHKAVATTNDLLDILETALGQRYTDSERNAAYKAVARRMQ